MESKIERGCATCKNIDKDGQYPCNVCGDGDYVMWELATPAPSPVEQEAKDKAKELIDKFAKHADCNHYEYMGAGRVEIEISEEKKINSAKQCALICNQREIELINRLLATGLNNDFDLLRERGKLMEVKQAITNQ